MKTAALIIKPRSPFGTPLKGDTLFGQFCWQVAEDPSLINGEFSQRVSVYGEKPFAIFSSAFPLIETQTPSVLFPRPAIASERSDEDRKERFEARKKNKKKKWMRLPLETLKHRKEDEYLTEADAFKLFKGTQETQETQNPKSKNSLSFLSAMDQRLFSKHEQSHNTINRLTSTTGTGFFAPYSQTNIFFLPGLHLVIFIAIDEAAMDFSDVKKAMARLGAWGFGRDASTGLGRFEVISLEEMTWPERKPDRPLYTLGPCVPKKGEIREYRGNTFIRFGKHGAELATSGHPFKTPVVMMDEGALLYPAVSPEKEKPYVGTGLTTGLSKAERPTLAQGYALALPLEGGNDA